jgi:tetratricopeptide (TPR) repeat protein
VALRENLPLDDLQPYAGFYMDLKNLTADLKKAERTPERLDSARLAYEWSQALYAAAEQYEPMVAITGTELAHSLGAAGRPVEAIELASSLLPVLRRLRLGAIAVSLLDGLGIWLRHERRWTEAVSTELEALALVRARETRMAVLEIHYLRRLARSRIGAGLPDEARSALVEALGVLADPGPGVVALRAEQLAPIEADLRADLASLDSAT